MEELLNAFVEPAFIAASLFSIALYFAAPVLERLREILLQRVSSISSFLRSWIRRLKAKKLRKIKTQRQNGDLVSYELMKANAYLVLFFGCLAAFWWLLLGGVFLHINTLPIPVQLFMASPIFVFEVLWMLQQERSQELLKYRGKLGVTRYSTRSLRSLGRPAPPAAR